MKNMTFLIIFFLSITGISAQDYFLSFTGSGQSSDVDSIHILNLNQGTDVTLNANDILNLVGTIGIKNTGTLQERIKLYPNPMYERVFIEFENPVTEIVNFKVYNGSGILVADKYTMAQNGMHKFEISGLSSGLYTILVHSSHLNYASKLLSIGNDLTTIVMKKLEFSNITEPEMFFRSSKSTVQMQYNDGETLLFKGYSDNHTRVLTLLPGQSQTVNFPFVSCTDIDGNDYAVVSIGAQTFMAENLRTTRLNDGTLIPYEKDYATWGSTTLPAYCWYDTTQSSYIDYGILYNWFAVETGNLCPTGWHVPSNSEWNDLINYLWPQSEAGGRLKETGTTHWNTPNTGASNNTGFTGLPGGSRYGTGAFIGVGNNGWWWASSNNGIYGHDLGLIYDSSNVSTGSTSVNAGLSVRCVID